jgi:hypothetical protein
MTWWLMVLGLSFGGVALFILGVALWFFFHQRLEAEPAIRPYFTQFQPIQVRAYLDDITQKLETVGFSEGQDAVWTDGQDDQPVYLRLFKQEQKGTLGIATVRVHPANKEENLIEFLEFQTRFENQMELSTHNSDQLGAPVLPKHHTVLGLNEMKEPLELYQIHDSIVQTWSKGSPPLCPKEVSALELWKQAFKRELNSQVDLGGLILDGEQGLYRPTLIGALMMIGSAVWPVSFIRRWLHKLRASYWIKQVRH